MGNKRKTQTALHPTEPPVPSNDNQVYARVIEVRGGGRVEAKLALLKSTATTTSANPSVPTTGTSQAPIQDNQNDCITHETLVTLVQLPSKFKGTVWIKRGTFLLVELLNPVGITTTTTTTSTTTAIDTPSKANSTAATATKSDTSSKTLPRALPSSSSTSLATVTAATTTSATIPLKVLAEAVSVVTNEHVKKLRAEMKWPTILDDDTSKPAVTRNEEEEEDDEAEEEEEAAAEGDDDSDMDGLFKNTNRR